MDFTDFMFNYNKQTTTKKNLYSRKGEGETNIWYQVELTVLLLGHYQFICINKWYTIQLLFSAVKEWQLFPESSVDQFPLNSRFGGLQLECFYFNSKIGSKCSKMHQWHHDRTREICHWLLCRGCMREKVLTIHLHGGGVRSDWVSDVGVCDMTKGKSGAPALLEEKKSIVFYFIHVLTWMKWKLPNVSTQINNER